MRGRGRGRGGRGYHPYAPPARFSHRSVTFSPSNNLSTPVREDVTPPSPAGTDADRQIKQTVQEEAKKSTQLCAAFTATGTELTPSFAIKG
jgi:hypothetical protein